jgi:hypothetical protein
MIIIDSPWSHSQCLGHEPHENPLVNTDLGLKLAAIGFLTVLLPLLSLISCCCCGGGGNGKALQQKFAVEERRLREEMTSLDKQKADAMEQACGAMLHGCNNIITHQIQARMGT